jgi:mono/diheme cytochrome c family protein
MTPQFYVFVTSYAARNRCERVFERPEIHRGARFMIRFLLVIIVIVSVAGCDSQNRIARPAETPSTDDALLSGAGNSRSTSSESGSEGRQLFESRILPIFKSPDPSSCVQCHLAGVDLKQYIRPSHEETFVSLRDQGLIDLDAPEKSKILTLIQMGEKDNPGAALIHEKVRTAEFKAFSAWIKTTAADPKLRTAPKLAASDLAQPKRPVEVIRHARTDRLLASFENTIWAMRFRCMSCHTEGTPDNKKLVDEHGERVAWMKAGGPEATLAYLRTSKLIDPDNPEKSLLLRKPLAEVKHGGGKKMLPGDQGYKAFRTFLDDYAKIVKDQYADKAALPKTQGEPLRFGTTLWLKLINTPPAWGDRLAQVDVYAWDEKTRDWESEPVASSDRGVWGKGKLWQHTVTLQAAEGSDRAAAWKTGKPSLPKGRYLLKVYVDTQDRLANDWKAVLGNKDFAGQVEISSDWREGYGQMTSADAENVRK